MSIKRTKILRSIQEDLQAFATNSYVFQSKVAAQLKLYPTDLLILHVLSGQDRVTAGNLAKSINLTSGATTAAVDRLVTAGYVHRIPDDHDRRKVYVMLVQPKLAELHAMYIPIEMTVAEQLEQYTEEDLATIERFLHAVTTV